MNLEDDIRAILPISLYGLDIRLVYAEDAGLIVRLRSNSQATRYMITLDDDLEQQEKWIEEYKKREALGSDYYFVFESNGAPIGLARLSHIDNKKKICTASSWIKDISVKGLGAEMFVARFVVAFEYLGMKSINTSIHRDNYSALKHWMFFKVEQRLKKNNFFELTLTRCDFEERKDKYIDLYNIKANH